jgi:nicotinamidase-related amidase
MLTLPKPDRFATRRWLICLDLQREYVVPGRPRYAAAHSAVVMACRTVLGTARAAGWRVVHSQTRSEETGLSPREMFGAPIEGLRPLVTEPVFFRRGLSAFANPAFASELRFARNAEVFLIGFSLADTCLATAFAAIDEGVSLTLVEDAVGVGAAEGAADALRSVLRPFLRIVTSSDLQAAGLEVLS